MARKRRIEYPGAVYHVISRGNYRKDLFMQEGSGRRFEETLMDAVDRCGWEVYAYTLMSNHYHLALRTPEPNLVEGRDCPKTAERKDCWKSLDSHPVENGPSIPGE